MDLDDVRTILWNSGVDIWGLIDSAMKVASLDFGDELIAHRDSIVAKLYTNCPNCDTETRVKNSSGNGFMPNATVNAVFGSEEEEEHKEEVAVKEEEEHHHKELEQRVVDEDDEFEYDEEKRIFSIKEQLEDPNQTDDSLVDLLQTLADMDITFKALKETDIGRHVNRLRKHPLNDVRQLVKLLVRKWKDLVDEWVRSNTAGGVHSSSNLIADGDSPQQNISKNHPSGHHNQVPDFGYSPNPHNGSSSSDKSEYKPKAVPAHTPPPQRAPPAKQTPALQPNRQKQVAADPERLASARKRLQENYQEAQNAKKQRTMQVLDIHELPKGKAKNSFFGRNKSGFQRH
ncbi:putative mediator of RNA polymerase II transcription subunit 26c [Silene latifolia]|uniref:putative mediator of RNA polymerase II transcription subunit 26c n=1 Tax=Silene latifolia TaxID=37657 RepID=UPI003D77FD24